MNPQELRIGNFVSKTIQGYTTFCIVDYLDLSKETFKDEYEYLEPIPLTEEWLVKLGFSLLTENSAGRQYGYVNDHIFDSDLILTYWKTTHNAGKFFRKRQEIKHIHQLQNLYFALTGEELEIKEIMK